MCYITPDTYLGIVSVPDHPGFLVRLLTTPWTHPICYDDLNLSGAYFCFPTQVRLFYFPKPHFSVLEHIIVIQFFYQNLQ